MTHLLAILGLGLACALWYLVQRAAGDHRGAEDQDPAPPGARCGACRVCEDEAEA